MAAFLQLLISPTSQMRKLKEARHAASEHTGQTEALILALGETDLLSVPAGPLR